MNLVKLILVYMFVWLANRATYAETLPDYSAFSNLLQSRMKRDDHYHMKCHQSGTGKNSIWIPHLELLDNFKYTFGGLVFKLCLF